MRLFKLNEDYQVGEITVYNDRLYESLATITNAQVTPDTMKDWKENYVSVSGVVVKPFIESITRETYRTFNVTEVIIIGNNFDDTIEVHSDILDDTDFNLLSITPTEITLEVTTSNVASGIFNLYKSGVKNYGVTPVITVTDEIIGTGQAGTFTTSFANATGDALWVDWTLETFGASVVGTYFASSDAGTPSGNTGPSTGTNGYYAFVETSNPNNGAGNYGQAVTSNFRNISQIDFDYHMFGSDITALKLQGFNGGWVDIVTLTGEQQAAQGDAWLSSSTSLTPTEGYEQLRFVFEATTSYMGDIALDNIVITSL